MRYVQFRESISADGLGKPVVSIYFSYCDKKEITGSFCPMCQNSALQKDGVGYNLRYQDILDILDRKLSHLQQMISRDVGIAFLGGEPLADKNRDMFMRLSEHYEKKHQLLYTWRMPKDINKEWIKNINKTVCGEYIDELNIGDEYLLGSKNQLIIDNNKKVILKY